MYNRIDNSMELVTWEKPQQLREVILFTKKYVAKKTYINGKFKKVTMWVK